MVYEKALKRKSVSVVFKHGIWKFLWIFILVSLIGVSAAFGVKGLAQLDNGFCEKLLYGVLGKTFFSDVYVKFPSGKVQKISPDKSGIYYQAHINRQGTKVVFYGNALGAPRIWLTDLEEQETRALTPENVSARHPVFSWDGQKIAFSSDMASTPGSERIELMNGNGWPPQNRIFHIYVMDANGNNVRQVTRGPFIDQRPAFSPDGKTIAFVSNRGGEERIWTVPVSGEKSPVPLQTEGFGYRPTYSPDGEKVFFFTRHNDSHQLCFINVSDKQMTLLDDFGRGSEHGPFVTYDGETLFMHSNRSGKWEIWKTALGGNALQRVRVPFDEALHVTVSKNGTMAFDVPRINEIRKMLSAVKHLSNQVTEQVSEIYHSAIRVPS